MALQLKSLTPGQVVEIPINKLLPDPDQPRKSFDDASLEQLAESLKHGVQVPLLVRPGKGAKYVIHDVSGASDRPSNGARG